MWDLLQGATPFQAVQPEGVSFSYEQHLANTIALFGRPLRDLIERGGGVRSFLLMMVSFSVYMLTTWLSYGLGESKYPELVPKDAKLKKLLDRVEGDEREAFLNSCRKCCNGTLEIGILLSYYLNPGYRLVFDNILQCTSYPESQS